MTLTEASFWTKRFGIIAAITVMIIFIILLIVVSGKKPTVPQEYLSANFACTETAEEFLEKAKITIPSLKIDPDSISQFEELTKTGKINELPSVINVYKFENPTQSWTSETNATILAGKLGFDKEKINKDDLGYYKWRDNIYKRTLVVNAKNLNFVLETDISRINETKKLGVVPDENSAKSTALNVLNQTGLISIKDEFLTANMTVTYIDIDLDGTFKKASSQADAELVRVDFVRERSMITFSTKLVGADQMVKEFSKVTNKEPKITKKTINDKAVEFYTYDTPIVLDNYRESNISVWIGNQEKDSKLTKGLSSTYRIEFTYWPISYDPCGTYPLIPTSTAVEEVKKGNGSITFLYEDNGDYISGYVQKNVKTFRIINDVRLFYYESPEELNFLVPIYLISGEAVFADGTDGEFNIYYPAIDYNNLKDKIIIKQETDANNGSSFL